MVDQEKEREMVMRIANLIKENKEINTQLKELNKRNDELQHKNDYFEKLIAQIPPEHLPSGIKPNLGSKTLRFKMATVLYVDIQGLKEISKQRNSEEVIDELDQIFFHFNKIVKKHKLEKIKTIGDAYMAAGGVPLKNITNPIDVVLAALEMENYLAKLKEEYENENKTFWDFKLGIHTGGATATASGKKRISYDLKGDTVNIATRMAASSDMGKVNISVMTYELVKEYFICEYHGKIPVKYQGDMEMYFMKRVRKAYSEDRKVGLIPNRIFWNKYLLRQFTDLQEIILDKLERELPDYLFYHNYKHTIDVVNQAELIGYGEGVDDEAILLLKTAALFHDAGHTINYENHEYYGTQIAKEFLPKYKYTKDQIETINKIIMATKLPPKPETRLQKIICDSDLDYLGRSDFIPVSNTLYDELKAQNKMGSLNDWNKIQVKFLSMHQFFTDTANKLREVNKQSQIERIKDIIEWKSPQERKDFEIELDKMLEQKK